MATLPAAGQGDDINGFIQSRGFHRTPRARVDWREKLPTHDLQSVDAPLQSRAHRGAAAGRRARADGGRSNSAPSSVAESRAEGADDTSEAAMWMKGVLPPGIMLTMDGARDPLPRSALSNLSPHTLNKV